MNNIYGFILAIMDILIYNFTPYKSFLFLLSLCFLNKKDYLTVIALGIFIDLVITNTLFINTIILSVLFYINKYLFKIKRKKVIPFLLINLFNYGIYSLTTYLIYNHFNLKFISINLINNLIINLIFWLFSYNLMKKSIKINR